MPDLTRPSVVSIIFYNYIASFTVCLIGGGFSLRTGHRSLVHPGSPPPTHRPQHSTGPRTAILYAS